MATFDLDTNHAKFQIKAYQPGWIKINDQIITKNLIITPDELYPDWIAQTAKDIDHASLNIIETLQPDVFLIGTGRDLIFLSIEVYGELINQGIGVEVMDTRSACHTFNALTSENRRVAAALILQ